ERLATVPLLVCGLAVQRCRLHDLAGAWMANLAAGTRHHDGFAAKNAEFLTVFVSYPCEKRRETVIIFLTQRLVGVMMALGALQTDAQGDLRSCFGKILRIAGDAVVVGRPVAKSRAARGEQLPDKTIERLVVTERGRQPIMQRPHALLTDGVAVGPNQIGPL